MTQSKIKQFLDTVPYTDVLDLINTDDLTNYMVYYSDT